MASPIEDVTSLPGQELSDQMGRNIGTIKEIYAADGDGDPMWVTVEASSTAFSERLVFVPLARIKEEDGEFRVPYSIQHIEGTPEVQAEDELWPPPCESRVVSRCPHAIALRFTRSDDAGRATCRQSLVANPMVGQLGSLRSDSVGCGRPRRHGFRA